MSSLLSGILSPLDSTNLGLRPHVSTYYHFNEVFQAWLNRNGLKEADLIDISPSFKGLPCIITVPILRIDPTEELGSEVKLLMNKMQWYGVVCPKSGKQYLFSMEEAESSKDYCLIVGFEQNHDENGLNGLTLWLGQVGMKEVKLTRRLFYLPNSDDVEKLLACYAQLRFINSINILEIRED